jgi:hypothetical protein
MSRKPKREKIAGKMRLVVSHNIRRAMETKYAGMPHHQKALHLDVKKINDTISLSTVQRAIKGDTGSSIDTIEAIAEALGIAVWQLFIVPADLTLPDQAAARRDQQHVLHDPKRSYAGRESVPLAGKTRPKASAASKPARKV